MANDFDLTYNDDGTVKVAPKEVEGEQMSMAHIRNMIIKHDTQMQYHLREKTKYEEIRDQIIVDEKWDEEVEVAEVK